MQVPMLGSLRDTLLELAPSESGDPEPDLLWQLLREGVVYGKVILWCWDGPTPIGYHHQMMIDYMTIYMD